MSLQTKIAELEQKVGVLETEATENEALVASLKAEVQTLKDIIANLPGNTGEELQPAIDRIDAVIAKLDKNTPAPAPEPPAEPTP